MGRQLTKRIDMNDLYPLFTLDSKDNLDPSAKLLALTTALGVAHIIAGEPET